MNEIYDLELKLFEAIEHNPNISVSELKESLIKIAQDFTDIEPSDIESQIEELVEDSKSKHVFNKAYKSGAAGKKLLKPNAWEISQGIDFILSTSTGSYNIDVKRSDNETTSYEVVKGEQSKPHEDRIIIKPGLSDEFFEEDRFDLTDESSVEVIGSVHSAINAATNEYDRR